VVAFGRQVTRCGDLALAVLAQHADDGVHDGPLQDRVDADRRDTATAEFVQYRALDSRLRTRPRVVERAVDDLGNVVVECRDCERTLSGCRDERLLGERVVGGVMEEARPFEAGLCENDGVVPGFDLAFHRTALDFGEAVEPLLDGLVELVGVCVCVFVGVGLFLVLVGVGFFILLVVLVVLQFASGSESLLVFVLEVGCEQFLETRVDVATEWLNVQVGAFGQQLGLPAEAGGADGRILGERIEVVAVGRHEDVRGGGAFGDAGDDEGVGLLGGHVLYRVDGTVEFAVEYLLVETADKGPGRAEAVDEFVGDLVASCLDLDEFDGVSAVFECGLDGGRLSACEIGPSGRQPECPAAGAHTSPSAVLPEKPTSSVVKASVFLYSYGHRQGTMVTVVDVLGVTLVASIIPVSVMVYAAWRNRTKPAAFWFAVLAIGIAGWSVAYGASLLVDDPALTIAAANVDFFFTDTVSIAWFLLALEYVRRRRVSNRWAALFAFPILSQVFVWTNPQHQLVRTGFEVDALGVLHPAFGPWFYVQTLFSYLLVVGGLVLFIRDYRASQGIRRNQTSVLIVGALVPFVANIFYVIGFSPYPDLDVTPLAFLITSTVFTWGLYRYRLLELIPIARKTVLDEMQDAVITLDQDDRIADINPRAARILGVDRHAAVGEPGESVFSGYPQLVDRFRDETNVDTEVSLMQRGEQRHFHLDVSPIDTGGGIVEGRVVVLRDISERKERERELDLLKQVLSRVLRHNIRNDVTVVTGYAQELAEKTSGEHAALAETIVEKSDDMAQRSQKAVAVERVLSSDTRTVDIDLPPVVEECVGRVRQGAGDFEATLDLPETCLVHAHETLEVALTNVIENAVEHNSTSPDSQARQDAVEHNSTSPDSQARQDAVGHNDADLPHVSITVTCEDPVELVVEDDGPGIPEDEIAVFESGRETKLRHSTGVGLWLALLIVRRSGGDVLFENTDEGARVTITLDRA